MEASTLEFNVAQLLREPVGSRRAHDVSESCLAEDGDVITVEGSVVLLKTDAGVLATAELASRIKASCSRCLAPAEIPLMLSIEEEYYPMVDVVTGALLPPPEGPSTFLIDAHHVLDLCEAVRQQRILSEPMQPLCRPSCAGLCPACGADLNAGPCSCPAAQADPRWAALSEVVQAPQR